MSEPGDGDESKSESLTPEERFNRIAEAAYLRAAARGFVGGDAMQDWLDAEMELMNADDRNLQDDSQSTQQEM